MAQLQTTGATLVWASTTPVPAGSVDPPRRNSDVIAYNAAAAAIMREQHIPIDDLYSYIYPRLSRYQLRNNVHFSTAGYQVLGEQVANSIRPHLPK